MNLASDMLSLRHRIDALRRERTHMVGRLRRFSAALHSDTAKMLAGMRKRFEQEHTRMHEMRAAFNAGNHHHIESMIHALRAERGHARRNWMGKKG